MSVLISSSFQWVHAVLKTLKYSVCMAIYRPLAHDQVVYTERGRCWNYTWDCKWFILFVLYDKLFCLSDTSRRGLPSQIFNKVPECISSDKCICICIVCIVYMYCTYVYVYVLFWRSSPMAISETKVYSQ